MIGAGDQVRLQMLLNKELEQVSENDLLELIQGQVEESITLEFKRELTTNKEIAKDTSSMANSKGGTILYGLEQDRFGRASKLIGVDPQGAKERIENVVLSAIQPRLETSMSPIPFRDQSKIILLVRIPESSRAPHMVTLDHDYRYYRRHNFQAAPMEEFEVRELYQRASRMASKADKFLGSRGYALSDPNRNGEPWVSIVVCPMILHDDLVRVDQPTLDFITSRPGLIHEDIRNFWNEPQPSLDGLECVRREPDTGLVWRFFEANRNGSVTIGEAIPVYQGEKKLQASSIAMLLVNAINIGASIIERAGYLGTVKIILGVNNVSNFALQGNTLLFGRTVPTLKSSAFLQVVTEKYSGILKSQTNFIAKEIMDRVYNGFGLLESDIFDKSGRLVLPRF